MEDETAISTVQYKIFTQAPFCHKVRVAQTGAEAIHAFRSEIPIVFVSGNMVIQYH